MNKYISTKSVQGRLYKYDNKNSKLRKTQI